MNIFIVAYKLKRRLAWFSAKAETEAAAIASFRSVFGREVEPYAGPLRERCGVLACDGLAEELIGKPPWLAVCGQHAAGPFPGGWVPLRKQAAPIDRVAGVA